MGWRFLVLKNMLHGVLHGASFCKEKDIVGKLTLRDPSPARLQHLMHWRALDQLYGNGVFPPGLLDCLNCGLGEFSHCLTPGSAAVASASAAVAPGSDAAAPGSVAAAPGSAAAAPGSAAASRGSVAGAPEVQIYAKLEDVRFALFHILRKRLLVVDEQPTLTRMFTFQTHVECFCCCIFSAASNLSFSFAVFNPASGTASGCLRFWHFSGTGYLAVFAADCFGSSAGGTCAIYMCTAPY